MEQRILNKTLRYNIIIALFKLEIESFETSLGCNKSSVSFKYSSFYVLKKSLMYQNYVTS